MGEVYELFPEHELRDGEAAKAAKELREDLLELSDMIHYLKQKRFVSIYNASSLELQQATTEYIGRISIIQSNLSVVVNDPVLQRKLWNARMKRFSFYTDEFVESAKEAVKKLSSRLRRQSNLHVIANNDNPESD